MGAASFTSFKDTSPCKAQALYEVRRSEDILCRRLGSDMFRSEICGVEPILYYKNCVNSPTRLLARRFPLYLPPFAVGAIRLVIAPLHPSDQFQDLFNGRAPQGQDHVQ
jgi:hypothetical protein